MPIHTAIFCLHAPFGGFRLAREDAALWWLSTSHARRHFSTLAIMSDELGSELLARIGIRFDRHLPAFPGMTAQARTLSSAGRLFALHALAREGTPAVYLDHDVLLHRPLPPALLEAPCCMQSPYAMHAGFAALHERLKLDARWMPPVDARNSGILGGNDTQRMLDWTAAAIAAVNEPANAPHLAGDSFLLRCLIEETSQPSWFPEIVTLFPKEPIEADYEAAGYAHLSGPLKHSPQMVRRIKARMQSDHPEAWARILAMRL